jgi:hypothetical protein
VGHGFAAYLQGAVGTVCAGLVWLVFLAGLARLGTLAFLGDLRASFLACRYARIHRACPAGYRLADTIVLRAAASRRIWIVVNIAFDEKNARCVTARGFNCHPRTQPVKGNYFLRWRIGCV